MEIREIYLNLKRDVQKVSDFYARFNLRLEGDVDYLIAVYENDVIAGVGGCAGNVIKGVAVDESFRGANLFGTLISELVSRNTACGYGNTFAFTGPCNDKYFLASGFRKLEDSSGKVSLFEKDKKGIDKYLSSLKPVPGERVAAMVVNANPMTRGHEYLVRTASEENSVVHVFVVSEDRSLFAADVRYQIVAQTCAQFDNVYVHHGAEYMVSGMTFPTYFLKDSDDINQIYTILDARIFGHYIAPHLGITHRYVGEEPLDPVTAAYNRTLQQVLPEFDVEVCVIARKKYRDEVISASRVRQYIREGRIEELEAFVPQATYDFLSSDDAAEVIAKVRQSDSRH